MEKFPLLNAFEAALKGNPLLNSLCKKTTDLTFEKFQLDSLTPVLIEISQKSDL